MVTRPCDFPFSKEFSMRRVYATTFALVTALSVVTMQAQQPAGAAAQGDASRKVAGGGITAAGWKGKVDANEASKGATINDSKFAQVGSDFQINNGPAAVYWNPANTASGSYTVSATFTEPKYMSSNDHPHPYGLFIGGANLETDKASLLYCTPYGNGSFIVRGFGPAPFAPGAGRKPIPNEAVKKAEPGGAVTQEVAWVVTPEKAECKINGTVVASFPKAELVGEGKLSSLDGIVGIRTAHNVDVTVSNFKLTK
jgi:hypothetical protein